MIAKHFYEITFNYYTDVRKHTVVAATNCVIALILAADGDEILMQWCDNGMGFHITIKRL